MAFVVDDSVVPKRIYDEQRNLEINHGPARRPFDDGVTWSDSKLYFVHKIGDKKAYLGGAIEVGPRTKPLTEEQKVDYPCKEIVVVHTIFDTWADSRMGNCGGSVWIKGYSKCESIEILKEALTAIFYSKKKELLEPLLFEVSIAPKFKRIMQKGEH